MYIRYNSLNKHNSDRVSFTGKQYYNNKSNLRERKKDFCFLFKKKHRGTENFFFFFLTHSFQQV